tara:strand:- start:104 stop:499 length:396 start_codon:yes stop_codon:yes gene_type:complete
MILVVGIPVGSTTVSSRLIEQLSQIRIFTPRRFEIEHEILDAQPQEVERLLKLGHRMAQAIATPLRRIGQLLHARPLLGRQLSDPLQKIRELLLKGLFVHVFPLVSSLDIAPATSDIEEIHPTGGPSRTLQ